MFDLSTRRAFLGRSSAGLGSLALASLLDPALLGARSRAAERPPAARWTGVVDPPHLPQRVKRVIFLYMSGGPTQFETFDYKPGLVKHDGQPMPDSFTAGQPIAQLQNQKLVCLAPQREFAKHGESGQEISAFLPKIAGIADDICIIRSMHTDQINHDPAHTVMNTGTAISGRPSIGSWLTYGLGAETSDLPGFVVLTSFGGRNPQPISTRQWHSGFLPSRFQGVMLRSTGDPVHYLSNPPGVDALGQQRVIDAVQSLDRLRNETVENPEVETRIAQYEMAARMQTSVPELMNIAEEPQHVLDLYGVKGPDGSFGYNCLLARRMAERGVRFIQLYHRDWDHHNNLVDFMGVCSGHCDGPSAALVQDLKRRGMLDETLVVWGGEFGRTPMAQSNKGKVGRDHHMRSFSMWLAGGGIKGGTTYGATDELGYHAAENPVHVHDLHATLLHQLGLDHTRLTYRYQGRDFRLTDVAGRVVREILA